MLCQYGCEQEAKHQLKNGKWCCCKSWNSCSNSKKINSFLNKGREPWNKGKNKNDNKSLMELSEKMKKSYIERYGSKIAKIISKKKRKSMTGKLSGSLHPMYGKNHTEDSKLKIGIKSTEWWKKNPEMVEEQRIKMKNGWSLYMISKIKSPSKPEVQLREIVKELYPNCEFQYQILNYVVDIALPDHKIAIEYDGWYHFDTEEHKEYHKLRQEKIEQEGWTFLRYNIFQKFPNLEIIKNDIFEKIGDV